MSEVKRGALALLALSTRFAYPEFMATVNVELPAELVAQLGKENDFAASHGVPPLSYGAEQLEEDRRTLDRLGL